MFTIVPNHSVVINMELFLRRIKFFVNIYIYIPLSCRECIYVNVFEVFINVLLLHILCVLFVVSQGMNDIAEITHQNEQNIKVKYSTLLINVRGRLQQKGIDAGDFRQFVIPLFPPGDCIPHSADLAEMFEAITRNGLWNFWNYRSLEGIVQHFGAGDVEMSGWIKEYKADLAGFKACTKIANYLSVVDSNSSFDESDSEQPTSRKPAKYDYRYFQTLSLKLKANVTDRSLLYIDNLWSSVSECFLLPPLSALFHHIHKGCITVVWLLPTGLVPQLLKQIRQAGDFFQQHHIASVTLNDQCVYDEQTSAVEHRQHSVVSSHFGSYQLTFPFLIL